MLLMDLRRREWSDELLQALEIPREWLPKSYEGPEITELSAMRRLSKPA